MDPTANNMDCEKQLDEAKAKFDDIFKLTSAASKVISSDLTIIKVNQALTELLGFSAEEIEGTRILEYACEEYKQHWHDLQDAMWKNNKPFFKLDACLIRKDGSLAWVNVTTIKYNERGETFGFTVLDDISYRKNFEKSKEQLNHSLQHANEVSERLRSNERRLSQILETMAEGVCIVDVGGKLTYANPMAQNILGLYHDELIDKTFYDEDWNNLKIDGTPLIRDEHPMYITMSTGKPVYDQEYALQPNGIQKKYISINAAPLNDEKGNIIAGVATFMDVTSRRRDIEHKDEFISVASHELKTPLTSLKGALQLLDKMKDTPSPNIIPRLIEQANRSLEKVSILVSDLLNASRINEGQLFLNKSTFNLTEMIQDCCSHVQIAGEYNIIMQGDNELMVQADSSRIEQVMVNFVNNAIKYAPESKDIIITIKKTDDNTVKVSVTDNGPGISPEKIKHLFDRYYRVDTSGIQFSGLGLGLYISSEIIKKHGGLIGVDSKEGEGSSFWFTLPL
jgi:PAS domain S-box-containing protein